MKDKLIIETIEFLKKDNAKNFKKARWLKMKRIKIIVKLDVNEYELEEIMQVIRNYNFKILDDEEYKKWTENY